MKNKAYKIAWLAVLVIVVLAGGCARKRDGQQEQAALWTPAPVTGAVQLATPAPLPTALPTLAAPTRAAPTATTTRAPNVVVITEQDVLRAVEAGVAAQGGATLQGVGVDFTDGKMRLTAERASYSLVNVENLEVVGRLVAVDGQLQMETESVSPRGIVTSFIPTIANQVLAQYASRWYVEEVATYDNRLEMRVR